MNDSFAPERFRLKHIPSLLKETFFAWRKDQPWRLSAVVAYYAILSLPALLVIIINIVGYIWGADIVAGRLTDEIAGTLGHDSAESIRAIIKNVRTEDKSVVSTIIGIGALLFGATGVFYHLQLSLNEIWELSSDPAIGFKKIIFDRVKSFGFILIIGFLLLISFLMTTFISAISELIQVMFPDLLIYLVYTIDIVLSVSIITVLFALIFKYLPDAIIKWETVWIGAIITSILFVFGKFLLGLYFGQLNPGSTYGAAGSIVLILLWVSYSCLILFFGAEFVWVYAKRYGIGIQPNEKAIAIEKIVIPKKDEEDASTVNGE